MTFQFAIDFRMLCPIGIKVYKLSEIWRHFLKILIFAFSDPAMVG